MNVFKSIATLVLSLAIFIGSSAQQQIKIDVYPHIVKSIKGESVLHREKYINLAANPVELKNTLDTERFQRYINELEMTVGRKLFLVYTETRWGGGYRQDATRPGFMDTTFFKNQKNPNDNGLDQYIAKWGENAGVAAHDGHNAYPDFMDKYTKAGSDQEFPVNNDAAAEMVAYTLKYAYTDFQRPKYFELVNEPDWRFWSDQRFIDHHVKAKQKAEQLKVPTEIGGPCFSVGNFYKKNFTNLSQLTNFIDATNNQLDFYSFHIYDYMKWDNVKNDIIGSVSSGLPEEAVFDALAAYTYNKYGKEFTFVGSEHGGYITDGDNRKFAEEKLSNMYFPGSGFQHEMEKRSISNFVMVNSAITNTLTFMNHPHIVKKAVPFILLQSANWDPTYYSSLLVKENFDKNSSVWHEAKLLQFFEFFKDVRGHRVKSFCNDNDIQQLTLVDKNRLIMVFHNQSNTPGFITANVKSSDAIREIKIRRLFRKQDFRPEMSEEITDKLYGISIGAQESIVIFVDYENNIEQQKRIEVTPYYSAQVSSAFTGTRNFIVNTPNHEQIESAVLRVGIGRIASAGKEVNIKLNGVTLNIPVEDCAGRLTSSSDYATLRSVKFDPAILKETNTVEISFPDGQTGGVGAVVIRAAKYIDNFPLESKNIATPKTQIYPNPSRGNITIHTPEKAFFSLLAIDGRILFSDFIEKGNNSLSLGRIQSGNYIARLQFENRVETQKLVLN